MDRIDDAYNGLMGEEFMRKTRERLHWMCSKVDGVKILDIGCSQGTLARILGSLGKNILGVDINKEAIAFAEGKLAEMDASTRERVRFSSANFMDFKTEERFETVVIGEVLEHLAFPEAFVKKAHGHLVKNGVIVVTVPFGINDDPDHRQTFYWSWINEIIVPYFDIKEVKFLGKWIGVVGVKRDKKVSCEKSVPFDVVKELEKAFYAIERPIVNDNKIRTEKMKAQQKTLDDTKASLSAAKCEAIKAVESETVQRTRADKAAADYAKLKTELTAEIAKQKEALSKAAGEKTVAVESAAKQKTILEGEVARQKTALVAEQAKTKDLNSKVVALRNELTTLKNEAVELRANLDASDKVSAGQAEQITVLKAALQFATNRPQIETNEARLLEYSQEVRTLRSSLDMKRDEAVERAERLGHLMGQVEALKVEKELLAGQVTELTEKLSFLKQDIKEKDVELEAARREVEKIGALSVGVQDELNEAKSRIQGLENSLERAKENAAHAQHINDEAEQRILKFAEAAKSLERQLEVAHQAMETAKADLVAATKREEEAKTISAKTDAQLKQVNTKVVTLEAELAKAKTALLSEQKKSAEQAAALKKANDACVEERKKTSMLTAQVKERDAKNLELRKEKQTLHADNRKLEKRLKRTEFDYNKLSKAKLGRLTLAYWRWKDGVKTSEKNVAKAVDCNGRSLQKTHMPVSSAKPEESSRLPAGERMLEKLRDAASKGMLNYRERCNFLKGVKVACIMDEFTWKSYSPEANMIQLVPENYEAQLNAFRPELIFVESAWRGVDNKWTNCVHKIPEALQGILKWAKQHNTATVFWNKEDPIHFDTFKNVASLFDFIFTYDFNCVEKYKKITGKDNAFFLPMAVQPTMFNPIEKYKRKDAFCFAGSYYKRYVERTKDLDGYIKAFPAYKNVEIYDRQFGKDDPNYMMPPEYAPYIKGNLPYDEIDKAYKGYTVSINLNSIKQANSIARRVFELLACNTVTVSNYSYGVVTGFGKLVITSDNADVILATLKNYENVPGGLDKFRLLGLRKVFSENTYEDRFAYICSKVLGVNLASYKPIVAVVAAVRNEEEYQKVKSSFERQKYGNKKLIVLTKGNVSAETVIKGVDDLPQHLNGVDYVGMMSPDDYYSASYLEDMAYAFRYAFVNAVGKGSYFRNKKNKVVLQANKKPYSKMCGVNLYRGMMTMPAFMTAIFDKPKVLTSSTPEVKIETLSIDCFNYCESGCLNGLSESQISEISDLTGVDTGFDFSKMQKDAETLEPVSNKIEGGFSLSSTKLYEYCKKVKCANIEQILENGRMSLLSSLDKGAHAYFPINKEFQIEDIPLKDGALCLNQEVGYSSSVLSSIAYFFYDARKRKISSALGATNANLTIEIPKGAKYVKFQFRLQGSGTLEVGALNFSHKPTPLPYSFDDSKILCLTNHYPSYDNIYRNGFVHARIKLYEQNGVKVSVFQFSKATQVQFSEFEGINVVSGNSDYLRFVLANNKYSTILVHFLDSEMWEVLKDIPETTRIIVWCHGAEVLKYTRRLFNFEGMEIPANVIAQSEVRGKFWSSLLGNLPKNIHFVFVSQWMKDIVDEDYSVKIPMEYYSIINNPINTEIFQYVKKDAEQRYHILSIRPYATRKYANDLSVKCILELSKRPDFKKFEITMIGDGKLFDDVLAPLKRYENVHILRTFLRQEEIYEYHKKNGIFLVPTRQDSQGVSKDEAMSSGLIPVTNAVTAIPEFVDASCGVLSPGEDYLDMAHQIGRIVDNPALFLSMSRAAAERVRRQTASDIIIQRELKLIQEGK